MLRCRKKCFGFSCQRLPFLLTVLILLLLNTWLWCNVFSANCAAYQPLSLIRELPNTITHRSIKDKKVGKKPDREDSEHGSDQAESVNISQLLEILVDKKKSLFDSGISLVPDIDLSSLDVPTLSPEDKGELQTKILKMSKLKKEYEVDEMMKQIDKNERNLKRVNISISISKENNENFEKKAAKSKAQVDSLVRQATKKSYAGSEIILKVHKLLEDLEKIEDRIKTYQKLLEKQQGLIIQKLALQHNLTFFESVLHNNV